MKTSKVLKCSVAILGMNALVVSGQGTFQNLDSESINPNVLSAQAGQFVPLADALPAWTGYWGTNVATEVIVNGISLGGVLITVITPFASSYNSYLTNYVIDGIATVTLDSGYVPVGMTGYQAPAAIAQTGTIPVGTRSLRFSLGSASNVGFLSVTLNGQDIPIFPLTPGPNYTVYGGDITAFAGSTAELRFTESPRLTSQPWTKAFLDDIQFSNQPIPEPSELGLCTLAIWLLGWRLVRKRHSALGFALLRRRLYSEQTKRI